MDVAHRLKHLHVTKIREFVSKAPDDVVNFGLGQTNKPVPEVIRERLVATQASESAPYIPNAGIAELRACIAEGYGIDAERVIVTAGVQEALFLSMMATLNPGMRVGVPEPGFPVYASIARICGAIPVPYLLREEDAFRPTPAVIEEVVEEGVDAMVLCSPGNPTGAVATPEQWEAIGTYLHQHEITVFSDEIYLSLGSDGPVHSTITRWAPQALCTSGLSKSHGLAGWRLGWLVTPSEMAPAITALHQHIMTSASSVVQYAALGAFTPEGEKSVSKLRAELSKNRAQLRKSLEDVGWVVAAGEGALYLWVRHPAYENGEELATILRDEHGVLTIPGMAFGQTGSPYIRLSYSLDADTLNKGIERLLTFSKA